MASPASTVLKHYRTPRLEADQLPGSEGIFNSDSQADILKTLHSWASERILLVYSRGLAAASRYIDDLEASLGSRLVASKAGVGSHSPYRDVADIAHLITSNHVDCLVCVGSGSYSDACKSARLLAATLPPGFGEKEMEQLIDQRVGIAPEAVMKKPTVKLVLVPTSLSAGEWNSAASCTNSAGKKQHFALRDGGAADLVLMDPRLARMSPEHLWLSSGMRAVDHAIETLCNPKSAEHPDAQTWCEEALRGLSRGLVGYKEGLGGDQDALLDGISKCQAGSRMAFMGFLVYRIPMGASHAIGHQLGSVAGVMHGITSCIMLPAVLRFTKPKTLELQSRVVKMFNESLGWRETEAAACVARLVRLLGLPGTLGDVGVTSTDQIEDIIEKTMTDVLVAFGLALTREDVSQIVYSAG